MSNQVEQRLQENNLVLPTASAPAANYVPYRVHGGLVYISGQLPLLNGELHYVGKIGEDYNVQDGQEAAKFCALNILSQLKMACNNDLSQIDSCLRLGGFVNCTPEFTKHPFVINGASNVMMTAFGDNGLHARAAVGVNSLPLGVAVEVEAIFALKVASYHPGKLA